MLVYKNKQIGKVYYGDKRIARVYTGNKLMFLDDVKWKYAAGLTDTSWGPAPLLYEGNLVISSLVQGAGTVFGSVNDVYSGNDITIMAQPDGLYVYTSESSKHEMHSGNWQRVSLGETIDKVNNGNNEFDYYKIAYGLCENKASVRSYVYGGGMFDDFITRDGEIKKVIGSTFLSTDGKLFYGCMEYKTDSGFHFYKPAWRDYAENVRDFSRTTKSVFLRDDSLHPVSSPDTIVKTFDENAELVFCDHRIIADGIIIDIVLNDGVYAVQESNIGGFIQATETLGLKGGKVYNITDLSNVTLIGNSPGNVVDISGPVARTSDNRFFLCSTENAVEIFLPETE